MGLGRMQFYWGIAIAIGFTGMFTIGIDPTSAGRAVLNQSPATIEKSFGRYWTKLTHRDPDGILRVTYTYNPSKLRRIFPSYPKAKFFVIFVNDRAQSIHLTMDDNENAQEFTYNSSDAAKFFEFIFGYRPAIHKPLFDRFTGNETIHDYVDCLGDGVATAYTIGGANQFLLGNAQLYYSQRCEPPYDRIQRTNLNPNQSIPMP
ncbi:hypothetical protein ACN4EG_10370 [Alkalinema pantanalense CENA528]|uniref:hypothetical protein n=1 Tax=Alkalinema pantanalense TaxID=1620705 RepID=UPI003D6E2F5A